MQENTFAQSLKTLTQNVIIYQVFCCIITHEKYGVQNMKLITLTWASMVLPEFSSMSGVVELSLNNIRLCVEAEPCRWAHILQISYYSLQIRYPGET